MDGETQQARGDSTRHHFPVERMNALTDGVFAIVLTLLVLELKLPEQDEPVLTLLADDWHVFVAWLISFVAITRFWLVHHAITARMKHVNNRTLQLNFAVLGAVSLIPFSAGVFGAESLDEPWSTVIFALNIGLLSLTVGVLALHTERATHLLRDLTLLSRVGRHRQVHLYVLPGVTAVAAAMAFVQPHVAVGLLVGEFLVFVWFSRRT